MAQPAAPSITPLYSEEAIAKRVDELAAEIAALELADPIIVAVLKGSFIFAADLIRALQRKGLAPEIDFIFLASYGAGTASSGQVKVLRDVESELEGRDVVIVDDILDSGRTLAFAKEMFAARGSRSVRTCVLLDKKERREVSIEADFVGFDIPNKFVVGYGLDFAERYRNLPCIGVLKPERQNAAIWASG